MRCRAAGSDSSAARATPASSKRSYRSWMPAISGSVHRRPSDPATAGRSALLARDGGAQHGWRRGGIRMASIAGELVIDRPVDEVFDFVADEQKEPRYNPRIRRAEKLSPGPIGRGTRFRAEAVTLGRTVGMTIEYTTYERPRRLASSIHMAAADIRGTLCFDPVPTGTRMSWSWEMRLRGLYTLLTPIIAGSGRRQEQANWAGLKQFLEGQASLVASPDAECDL